MENKKISIVDKSLLIKISSGFANAVYDDSPGYWGEQMNWFEGPFNPYGWMADLMVKSYLKQ